ncbi:glycosyltransferase [Streptomyces sp. MUM 203J]|nr:glycosyltransferase [Streptomyces sp. MUM 203J]
MPYLTKTLTSVVEQSVGRDRLEVIAVDDGSTDGTGEELDRFAAAYPGLFRVFHQENSGGPAAPRNKGLDHARGRFVFILDADDWLGEEALERMLTMADENKTDVVLGKMVGVNGRGAPASMFVRNQPRTDVLTSRVYWTLNPMKLFRRSLLEEHGLRFPLEYNTGEDQFFTGAAYLHADGISVVADYDCVYWVARTDGGNVTATTRGADRRIRVLERMIDMVEQHVPAGPGRDALLDRHLSVDLFHALIHLARETDGDLQRRNFAELRALLERSYPDSLRRRVSPLTRLRCELILRGLLDEAIELEAVDRRNRARRVQPDILVDRDRAYLRLPYFRDPARGIPDEIYDITGGIPDAHRLDSVELDGSRLTMSGHAYLRRVAQDETVTELVLRERGGKGEHRFPTIPVAVPGLGEDQDGGRFDYTAAGFTADVDLAAADGGARLADGLWDVFLALRVQGVTREIRFGHRRLPEISGKPSTYLVPAGDEVIAATLYYTHPYGNLTVDIGENKHRAGDRLRAGDVRWSERDPSVLEITAEWTLATPPPAGTLGVRLTEKGGAAVTVPASVGEGRTFSVAVPVDRLTPGTWDVSLRLAVAGSAADWSRQVPPQPGLKGTRWRRRCLPRYALPTRNSGLALRVGRVAVAKAVARRARRLLP